MDEFTNTIEELFRGEGQDLCEFTLTSSHKIWLVEHIISKEFTAASIARKFNIPRKRLNKWTHRYNRGHKLVTITGRPRVFHEQQLSDMVEFTFSNPDAPLEDYKHYISDLYADAYSGIVVNNNINPDDQAIDENPTKIARNTLKAYTDLCMNNQIKDLVPWVA